MEKESKNRKSEFKRKQRKLEEQKKEHANRQPKTMARGAAGATEQSLLKSGAKVMHPARTGAAEKDVHGSASPNAWNEADSQNSQQEDKEDTSGYGKGPKIQDSPYKAAYIGISK